MRIGALVVKTITRDILTLAKTVSLVNPVFLDAVGACERKAGKRINETSIHHVTVTKTTTVVVVKVMAAVMAARRDGVVVG